MVYQHQCNQDNNKINNNSNEVKTQRQLLNVLTHYKPIYNNIQQATKEKNYNLIDIQYDPINNPQTYLL